MTTKKELRKRLDLHINEITKNYQQIAETRATVKQLQQTAELHTQQLTEWRTLFENTQSAVCKIRELTDAAADRENNRQKQIQHIVDDVAQRLQRIGELVTEINKQDGDRLAKLEFAGKLQDKWNEYTQEKIDNIEKRLVELAINLLNQQEQQPNVKRPHIPAGKLQRKSAPSKTAPPKTSTAPAKTKLPTSPRTSARNRVRPPARTNPS